MVPFSTVPRRCVNLPPGSLWILLKSLTSGRLERGPAVDEFTKRFGEYLGSDSVLGVAQGRSAFDLALRALDLPKGSEIIFPVFTFPVMPLVAKLLGFKPVFCDVDLQSFNARASVTSRPVLRSGHRRSWQPTCSASPAISLRSRP